MTLRQALGLIALLGSAWLAFFADKTPGSDTDLVAPTRSARPTPATPSGAAAEAPARATAVQASPASKKPVAGVSSAVAVLALEERLPAPRPGVENPGAQAFGARSWTPPPPPPPPPQKPVAPPLPFGFLGKHLQAGVWQVYLTVGEDVRLARVAGVIDGQYRVESIVPPRIEFTYLPLNERQTLDIGAP